MMEKIARFMVAVAAFALIGGAGLWGLRSADAQTGGGFPSNPKFQTVTAQAANAGTAKNAVVFNPTSGVAAASALDIRNDLNATNHELELTYTSSTFSGAFLLSGPTGESASVYTPANQSLCMGTNGKCVILINGTTQNASMPQQVTGSTAGLANAMGFNIGFNGAGAPALQSCIHCGASPSAARGGVGSYTVTHNAAIGSSSLVVCTPANGTATYLYSVQNLTNTANITLLTPAGAAVDGTAAQSLSCIAIT